jgi:hypothetical protein
MNEITFARILTRFTNGFLPGWTNVPMPLRTEAGIAYLLFKDEWRNHYLVELKKVRQPSRPSSRCCVVLALRFGQQVRTCQ